MRPNVFFDCVERKWINIFSTVFTEVLRLVAWPVFTIR